jgi:DNA-binding MarR family transcriptional regulator
MTDEAFLTVFWRKALQRFSPMTRDDLARRTGLEPGQVAWFLKSLSQKNLLRKTSQSERFTQCVIFEITDQGVALVMRRLGGAA